jgi:ribonuclease VapC
MSKDVLDLHNTHNISHLCRMQRPNVQIAILMVVDSSAVSAAIANEPDGSIYREATKTARGRLMSAVTLPETRIVLQTLLGSNAITTFDGLIERAGIVVERFVELLSCMAYDAFRNMTRGGAARRS